MDQSINNKEREKDHERENGCALTERAQNICTLFGKQVNTKMELETSSHSFFTPKGVGDKITIGVDKSGYRF